jgi:hypothetical protein
VVEGLQKNRNPFVDRPEGVQAVFLPPLDIHLVAQTVRLTWSSDLMVEIQSASTTLGPWVTVGCLPTQDTNIMTVAQSQGTTFYRTRLR